MTIHGLIGQIAHDMTTDDFSFFYGIREQSNIKADKKALPTIILDEPVISDDVLHVSGYIESTYPITLLILYKSELGWSPEKHQEVITKARTASREIITKLSEDDDNVVEVSSIRRQDVFNVFDANLSGVVMTLTVKMRNNDGICF